MRSPEVDGPATRLPRHAAALVLVLGVTLFLGLWAAVTGTGNLKLVPTLLLVGAVIVPLTFLAFVRGRRMPFSVRGGTLAITALASATLATGVAGTLEDLLMPAMSSQLFDVVVAVIEETVKLVVPLIVVATSRRALRAGDGLLLGVASGAGFATSETMGFAFETLLGTRDDVAKAVGTLAARGLFAPVGHLAWTGLLTAAAVAAWRSRWAPRAVGRLVVAFVGVVALHAAWDFVGVGEGGATPDVGLALLAVGLGLTVAVVGLTAVGVVVHRLSRTEDLPAPAPVPVA